MVLRAWKWTTRSMDPRSRLSSASWRRSWWKYSRCCHQQLMRSTNRKESTLYYKWKVENRKFPTNFTWYIYIFTYRVRKKFAGIKFASCVNTLNKVIKFGVWTSKCLINWNGWKKWHINYSINAAKTNKQELLIKRP